DRLGGDLQRLELSQHLRSPPLPVEPDGLELMSQFNHLVPTVPGVNSVAVERETACAQPAQRLPPTRPADARDGPSGTAPGTPSHYDHPQGQPARPRRRTTRRGRWRMGVMDRFERRLDRMVHGVFARPFTSSVEPVEIARALQ